MLEIDISKLSVLVVDDESFMRQLIVRLVNDLSIRNVTTANDGADAMTKFSGSKRNFDIVICDLEMPKMDGFAFVRQLRARTEIPCHDVPVLIVTGHSEEESIQAAVKSGIHGFLVKPVSKQALESRIRAAMKSGPIDPSVLNR